MLACKHVHHAGTLLGAYICLLNVEKCDIWSVLTRQLEFIAVCVSFKAPIYSLLVSHQPSENAFWVEINRRFWSCVSNSAQWKARTIYDLYNVSVYCPILKIVLCNGKRIYCSSEDDLAIPENGYPICISCSLSKQLTTSSFLSFAMCS